MVVCYWQEAGQAEGTSKDHYGYKEARLPSFHITLASFLTFLSDGFVSTTSFKGCLCRLVGSILGTFSVLDV